MAVVIDVSPRRSEDDGEDDQKEEHAEDAAAQTLSHVAQTSPVDDNIPQHDTDHPVQRS